MRTCISSVRKLARCEKKKSSMAESAVWSSSQSWLGCASQKDNLACTAAVRTAAVRARSLTENVKRVKERERERRATYPTIASLWGSIVWNGKREQLDGREGMGCDDLRRVTGGDLLPSIHSLTAAALSVADVQTMMVAELEWTARVFTPAVSLTPFSLPTPATISVFRAAFGLVPVVRRTSLSSCTVIPEPRTLLHVPRSFVFGLLAKKLLHVCTNVLVRLTFWNSQNKIPLNMPTQEVFLLSDCYELGNSERSVMYQPYTNLKPVWITMILLGMHPINDSGIWHSFISCDHVYNWPSPAWGRWLIHKCVLHDCLSNKKVRLTGSLLSRYSECQHFRAWDSELGHSHPAQSFIFNFFSLYFSGTNEKPFWRRKHECYHMYPKVQFLHFFFSCKTPILGDFKWLKWNYFDDMIFRQVTIISVVLQTTIRHFYMFKVQVQLCDVQCVWAGKVSYCRSGKRLLCEQGEWGWNLIVCRGHNDNCGKWTAMPFIAAYIHSILIIHVISYCSKSIYTPLSSWRTWNLGCLGLH